MTLLPHDTTDLMLAPVALHVDGRLTEFAALQMPALRIEIALASDVPDRTPQQREVALLAALQRFQEMHGWSLSVDPRGVRMSHKEHTLVLGLPAVVRDFLDGRW